MPREIYERVIPKTINESMFDLSMKMMQILNAMMEDFRQKYRIGNDEFIDFVFHKEEIENGILMKVEFFTRRNEDKEKLLFG